MIRSRILAGVVSGIMAAAAAASAMTASADEFRLGDPTGDGLIDAIDASYILSLYADISVHDGVSLADEVIAVCDVDKDGKVNALDASLILSYYADQSIGDIEVSLEKFIENLENKVTSWWDENAKDLDLSAFAPDAEWDDIWSQAYPWNWGDYDGITWDPENTDSEKTPWGNVWSWWEGTSAWNPTNPYPWGESWESQWGDTDELQRAWQDYNDLLGEVDAESNAIAEGNK